MKNLNTKYMAIALIAVGVMVMAPAAMATPIGVAGTLSTGVTGTEAVVVTATQINFLPTSPPNITANTSALTDNGAPVSATTGFIKSLHAPTSFPVDQFLTLTGTPVDYVLNGVGSLSAMGINTPTTSAGTNCASLSAVNPTCTVLSANSPFVLLWLGTNLTEVILPLNGWVTDKAPVIVGGMVTNGNRFSGSYSTNIPMSAASIQSTILGGGSITCGGGGNCTDSGTLTATVVPEPTTMFLSFSGLLLAAGLYRRRKA